jgi:uncharacterized protein (DUF983 family)
MYLKGMIEEPDAAARPPRDYARAMWRGFTERCPNCGQGRLFGKYLKVRDACPRCGEALYHHRADDAPAYFTILIVGHFVVGGALSLERWFSPPTWVHLAIWLPLTLTGCLLLLPRVKGALVGLQWALYMHGFDGPQNVDLVPQVPAAEPVRQPRNT